MRFGRSDAEFWLMTPAQLDSLSRSHERAESGTGPRKRGTVADLSRLASMGG